MHPVSNHRCYVLDRYHEIDKRIVNVNNLPKRSTEGERSLIKHFVRSLSMPHELLMSMRNLFLLIWASGKLARASKFLPEGQAGIQVFVEPWLFLFLSALVHTINSSYCNLLFRLKNTCDYLQKHTSLIDRLIFVVCCDTQPLRYFTIPSCTLY